MFYFTVEELIENVSNKENYNISLYNRENSIVTISDSDSTIDYIYFYYDDRIFASRKNDIKFASETFEKEFHNYIERHKKDFSLAFQSLYDYEYNPIENYNRVEKMERKDGGTDNTATTKEVTDDISNNSTENINSTLSTEMTATNTTSVDRLLTKNEENDHTINESATEQTAYNTTETRTDNLHSASTSTLENASSGTDKTQEKTSGYNSPTTLYPEKESETTYGKRVEESNTVTSDNTGTQTNAKSGNDTVTSEKTGNNKDTIKGTDSEKYGETKQENNGSTNTNEETAATQTTTKGTKNENESINITYGKTENVDSLIHGNIGVTTTQQMINSELELRLKKNIIETIIDRFINSTTFYA